MDKKLKSTFSFILSRILNREKMIVFLFLLSLILVIMKEYATIDGFCCCIIAFVRFLSKANTLLENVAISYIAGIIVYFLTIILPETRRAKPVLIEIDKILCYLEDAFVTLSQDLQVGDWCNSKDSLDEIVNTVKHINKQKGEETFLSLDFCQSSLENLYKKFDELTSEALHHSSALTEDDLNTLVEIRQREVVKQLKYG